MSIDTGTILKLVATLAWTDGNLMQSIFSLLISGGGGPWDEDDVIDDLLAWIGVLYGNFGGMISDEVDGSQIQVYQYDPIGDDFDEVGSDAWVFDPNEATEQLPRGSAMLIGGRTVDPDVLGKKYIGGLCEGGLADGLYSSAELIGGVGFAEDWVAPFVGGTSSADYAPGVWSVKQNDHVSFRDAYYVSAIPAYQRRRKRGVGV